MFQKRCWLPFGRVPSRRRRKTPLLSTKRRLNAWKKLITIFLNLKNLNFRRLDVLSAQNWLMMKRKNSSRKILIVLWFSSELGLMHDLIDLVAPMWHIGMIWICHNLSKRAKNCCPRRIRILTCWFHFLIILGLIWFCPIRNQFWLL